MYINKSNYDHIHSAETLSLENLEFYLENKGKCRCYE